MLYAELNSLFSRSKPSNQDVVTPATSPRHPGGVMELMVRERRASDTQSAGNAFDHVQNSLLIFAPNPGATYSNQPAPSAQSPSQPRSDGRWRNLFVEEQGARGSPGMDNTPYQIDNTVGEPSYSWQAPTPAPAAELYDFRHLDRDPSLHPATGSFAPGSGSVFCDSPGSIAGYGGSYVNDSRRTLGAILGEMDYPNHDYLATGRAGTWTNSSGTPTDDQSLDTQQPYRSTAQVPYPRCY
ncbi:hypothetical protein FRC12_003488 [Ceratobasidium sp. 428]|nr:hypothetical protein FRC12_003488 [Ceratobasidium sp. 428]